MSRFVIAKYIRLSVDDAHSDSVSIESQRFALDKKIEEMDIPDAEVLEFVDNGYSGTNFERPGIQELLELVRMGEINAVMVKDFSRFGRNIIETGYFIERVFPLYQIQFISVSDDFDSMEHEGNTGGLEVSFKFLLHEQYSRELSEKIRKAKRHKIQSGEMVTKNCVIGYKLDENRNMIIDTNAAKTVKYIFKLAADGKSINEIIRALYKKKCPTPSEYKRKSAELSCIWDSSAIRTMLRDEQYTGMYIGGKTKAGAIGSNKVIKQRECDWVKIPNHHEAIIEKSLFDEVQNILNTKPVPSRKRKIGTHQRYKCNDNPLKGKVICGCCKHKMSISHTTNPQFQCKHTSVITDAECHRLGISADELTMTIFEIISKQAQVILDNVGIGEVELCSQQQSGYESQIEQLKEDKCSLYEQYVAGEIGTDDFKAAKSSIDDEIQWLMNTHSLADSETSKVDAAHKEIAKTVLFEDVLTSSMVELFISRVLIFPAEHPHDSRIEVEWKVADFFSGKMEVIENAE